MSKRTETTGIKQLEHAANNFKSANASQTILALRNVLIYGAAYAPQLKACTAGLIKAVEAEA